MHMSTLEVKLMLFSEMLNMSEAYEDDFHRSNPTETHISELAELYVSSLTHSV
ncbi:hypothetical protein J6590_067387 [Homalodisca vitripennis]|nr:hypothetical protein J6590_067387 [Homalodisca vitripennis]